MNTYLETGDGSPAYGARYLNELLNFIPRSIWPSKPLIGIDYAKWRGFESADSEDDELGVNTTISSGMIGGGVLNFGQILGPVAAGILMALWTGLLIRWWEQRKSLLRLVLFMQSKQAQVRERTVSSPRPTDWPKATSQPSFGISGLSKEAMASPNSRLTRPLPVVENNECQSLLKNSA